MTERKMAIARLIRKSFRTAWDLPVDRFSAVKREIAVWIPADAREVQRMYRGKTI